MALNKSEYQWRKTVRPEKEFPEAKGETCAPDERFSALDWHNYIEISSLYTKDEAAEIHKTLDELAEHVPEFRFMLRQSKDPVVHYSSDSKSQPEKKILIHPTKSSGFLGLWDERAPPVDEAAVGESSVNHKSIVIEPALIAAMRYIDSKYFLHRVSIADVIIHELVHQTTWSRPYDRMLNNSVNENPSDWSDVMKGPAGKGVVESILTKQEKVPEFKTNHIVSRYCNLPLQTSKNPMKRGLIGVLKSIGFAESKHDRVIHSSNLVPMTFVDSDEQRWKHRFKELHALQQTSPKEHKHQHQLLKREIESEFWVR